MRKKYVVRPGMILGTDGEMHQYNAETLVDLYHVSLNECVVLQNNDPEFMEKYCTYVSKGYIFLHPRSDEDYSWLHKQKLESVV